MRAVVVAAVLLVSARANAQVSVTVDLNPEGEMLAQQLGVSAQDLATRIQDQIDTAYDASNIEGFLRSFGDATAFSMRGLGVDYVSMPKNLIVGVGANVAVAASGDYNAEDRPTAGLSPNIGFMAGLNLSEYKRPRWTVFANGFYRSATVSSLQGSISSFGLHVQYRIVHPQADEGVTTKALRWTGIDVTTGLEITRWSLGVEDQITTDFAVDGTNGSASLVLDSMGRFDLTSTAATVPVEVSTGVRIALLLSVYLGAAFDLSGGSARLDANLSGTLRTSDDRGVGTTTIVGRGDNTASPAAARVLAGVQLNLWKLKVYGQVNGSATPAASVGFGIRGVL